MKNAANPEMIWHLHHTQLMQDVFAIAVNVYVFAVNVVFGIASWHLF